MKAITLPFELGVKETDVLKDVVDEEFAALTAR